MVTKLFLFITCLSIMPINNNIIRYSNLFTKLVEVSKELFLRLHGIDSNAYFFTYKYLPTGISFSTFRHQIKHSESIEGTLDPAVSKNFDHW